MSRDRIAGLGLLAPLFTLAALVASPPAWGQGGGTGISNDRVSLPGGPGSLEGVGENVAINPSMGQMSYSVPIKVPEGYPGMTPQLALAYSSGGGGSVVGMGWSLDIPYIERMTVRGLPRYARDDRFTANGSEHLVLLPATDPPVYRSRFENGFVRYTWKEAGDGREGYWTAEFPDGRIGYYGADATGTLVAKARVSGPGGTYRYHLVELMDRYGHKVRYDYTKVGNVTLLQHVGWVFAGDGGAPLYEATFEYEPRYDKLSDCKAGFNELLEVRLSAVNVLSRAQRIRQYKLQFEPYETSGGFTRLTGVQLHGFGGRAYPVHETFEYSRALGSQCAAGDSCRKPYVVEMGSLGVDLGAGRATLIDLNGDALPDVVDTSQTGPHRFWLNVLQANGTHEFSGPWYSALGTQSSHDLGSPNVQVIDVNGDGFADMVNRRTGDVLVNLGGGDWARVDSVFLTCNDTCLPDMEGDFQPQDGELRTIRFMDYDNDKRIDVVKSEGSGPANVTMVYRNNGSGGFSKDESVGAIGAGFEDDKLELDDVNGDGMLDAIQVTQSSLRYRLSLGWGQWAPWVEVAGFTFTDQEAVQADLEDLNGDGLADLVLVAGNEVKYWLNRNGATFDPERRITNADLGSGVLPERLSTVKVLYADMNGNGSHDVAWVSASGEVAYLELFPVRPNLLSRIKNGLGKVTDVSYLPSVEFQARDGGRAGWKYSLPSPMNLVSRTDEWDELTQVHQITDYTYHDGFYDGAEKQFRGYERVEEDEPADEATELARRLEIYDVGASDPYRAGLLLTRETQGEDGRSLQLVTNEYGECPLTGVPAAGLDFPVRYVCQASETTEQREGLDSSQWARVRKEYEYDGYGNVSLEANLGVVTIGGGACAPCSGTEYTGTPCGSGCLGDEEYRSFEHARPESNEGRWILRHVVRERSYGKAAADGSPASSQYAETLTYYDGSDFEGLPLGQIDHGEVARIVQRVDATAKVITAVRNKFDSHGNVVEVLDPLGAPGGDEHRRVFVFDDAGLHIVRTEVMLKDAAGPYALRQDLQYEPLWDEIIESTDWQVVREGSTLDPRNSTFYAYDDFGRIASRTFPGEASGFTSEEYRYELGSPQSRIVYQMRSKAGEAFDLSRVLCLDGHGRQYQERLQIAMDGDLFQVDGFTVFDTKGNKQEVFQPYLGTGPSCDTEPPQGTGSTRSVFDAVGRITRQILPSTSQDGADAPTTRRVYLPLATVEYDLEDTNTAGRFADTPTTHRINGLGASVAVERLLTAGGAPLVHTFRYDELGRLVGWTDPAGHPHLEEHDLLGRVVRVEDPDHGASVFEYDDAGNRVSETDARGIVRRARFDGASRLLAEWKDADEAATRVDYAYDVRGECPAAACTNTAGRLARVTYPQAEGARGEDRFGWDVRGREVYSGRLVGGHLFEFRSEYDDADRLVATTDPTGLRLALTVDGADRLVAIPGYVDSMTYEPRGSLAGMALENGTVISRTHDERQRLMALSAKAKDGSTLLDYSLTRDRVGHVVAVADGRRDDGAPQGGARYTLDALYRLVEARLDPDRSARAETLSMAYDAADNVTSMVSDRGASSAAHVGSYVYGTGAGPRAVTKAGDVTYAYDQAGQMIQRADTTFGWDHAGRLVSATRAGQLTSAVVYGPDEDRLVRREPTGITYYLGSNFEVQDGVAMSYVRVDKDRVVERSLPSFAAVFLSDLAPAEGADQSLLARPDGQITAADAWLSQQASAGAMSFASLTKASAVEELLLASAQRLLTGTKERVRYLHHDQLGSIVATTDEAGALVSRTEFYPHGSVRFATGEQPGHGFTGKSQDSSTGLIYFGARYLDPQIGRWTSTDPLFAVASAMATEKPEESTAAYGYVGGNPASYYDLRGLWKLASFVQGDLIKKLGIKTAGSGKLISAGKGGICAGLSLQWLSLMNKGRKQAGTVKQRMNNLETNFKDIATKYSSHVKNEDKSMASRPQFAPMFGISIKDAEAQSFTKPGYHRITVKWKDRNGDWKSGAHAIATFNKTSGIFSLPMTHFFDPNLGEFMFNRATAHKDISNLLTKFYGKDRWQPTHSFPLKK
ncbi:MAG: VCBS repeat-containing protein [Deltaproteobacteria bacterium]|nr:VCBS repeat-containing protein [Deltaproteobacteria bacterium]